MPVTLRGGVSFYLQQTNLPSKENHGVSRTTPMQVRVFKELLNKRETDTYTEFDKSTTFN